MTKAITIQQVKFYLRIAMAWVAVWLIGYMIVYPETFFVRVPNELWRTVYLVTVNCVFLEYAWPVVTRKRNHLVANIVLGLFVAGILMLLVSFGVYAWRQLGIGLHIYTDLRSDDTVSHAVAYQTGGGVASVVFFGLIKHIYVYVTLRATAQQLRIEKQQAELNYLKSQTNPHFLFNTLNNIYSLARDKSDLAPESILRLSSILRFMLYETGGEYITIEQELNIISDYAALERLRYDNSLRVTIDHDVEDMKQPLPPMLLIPLVENAFKHGVSETIDRPFVDIHLSVNQRRLDFVVKNSTEAFPDDGSATEHIGLSNLRRQLALLFTDYSLSAQQGASVFTAMLKVNLSSHV